MVAIGVATVWLVRGLIAITHNQFQCAETKRTCAIMGSQHLDLMDRLRHTIDAHMRAAAEAHDTCRESTALRQLHQAAASKVALTRPALAAGQFAHRGAGICRHPQCRDIELDGRLANRNPIQPPIFQLDTGGGDGEVSAASDERRRASPAASPVKPGIRIDPAWTLRAGPVAGVGPLSLRASAQKEGRAEPFAW
jgi:hypothetical protein